MLNDKFPKNAMSSGIGQEIQMMLLEWQAERNYQVGKVVDLLIRMYEYADKIKKHQRPYIEPTSVAFFGIVLNEFKGTSEGVRIVRRYPEVMGELEDAYNTVNKYTSRRKKSSTIEAEQQVNQVLKWLKLK